MRKTKIVATISDKRCDVSFIKALYEAGMSVVRLNTAHQTTDDTLRVINNVREVSDKIPFLVDTKGPEVRTRKVEVPFKVEKGDVVYISGDLEFSIPEEKMIHVSYSGFVNDVHVGDKILIDDGDLEFVVEDKIQRGNDFCLKVSASNPGVVKDKKSVNVPRASMKLAALSEKDKEFIRFAAQNGVDFIAHSFVRSKEDVKAVQDILDECNSKIKIIAKIENQEGVDNLDEILECVYGVMVARGDLAIEIEAEKIPKIQRHIISKCIERKKPVIVATQMLHTMIEHPRPTRAEVSDIANAVFMGTDALMLSGETAYGDYPIEAVQLMAKVAEENESMTPPDSNRSLVEIKNETTAALARVAVRLTALLPVKAVVVDTLSGRTARYLSAFRCGLPVYARCYNDRVMRELALSYGIRPSYISTAASRSAFLMEVPRFLLEEGFKEDDSIIVVGGSSAASGASFVEVSKINALKDLNF